MQNATLDQERDFYFTKLRDIEMLLQARGVAEMDSGNELGQDILKILYASEEEKVAVASDGKLTITSAGGAVERPAKVDVQISDEVME